MKQVRCRPIRKRRYTPKVGNTRTYENLEYSVLWTQALPINGSDWRLFIEQLTEQGTITNATLHAVHSEKGEQYVVRM